MQYLYFIRILNMVLRDVPKHARFLCDKAAVLGGHIIERPVFPVFDK
jgi:hypothetical protein